MVKTVLEYFTHASTWKGLLAVAMALGLKLSPEHQATILTVGMSLIGAIQVFVDDYDKTHTVDTTK